MRDDLRPLWDFDDLDGSERRFRDLLAGESSVARRAEILTQLARIAGLRGDVDEGDRLLDEAEEHGVGAIDVRIRVALERGRLRRSAGDTAAALALFEAAFADADAAGRDFLAADAAHMAALAAESPEGRIAWTERGVELAGRSSDAAYWLGPLLNNLGWERYEAGDYEAALAAFEQALAARERDPERPYEAEIARYAVAKALLALERPAEAAELLERAVAWADGTGRPDGWFHEELAYAYAALVRRDDARRHARVAVEVFGDADPAAVSDRLRELATP